MNKEEIFSVWAPDTSVWSPWMKPVLFAHLDSRYEDIPGVNVCPELNQVPKLESKTAIILDLPGEAGVRLGVMLAQRGYRPVPLYNSVPASSEDWEGVDPTAANQVLVAVNVLPIMKALREGAEVLVNITLPADAPPVFLLDAKRSGVDKWLGPGKFDNRSVSFTTDFPSANFLISKGIECVLLVQMEMLEPQTDLAHTLCRWQEDGIRLERARINSASPPEPFAVSRPSWYGAMFQRALAVLGLRRAGGGGFGGWVPEPGSGG
jgi:hypothetical protein